MVTQDLVLGTAHNFRETLDDRETVFCLSFFFFFFRKKVPRCIFVRIKVYLTVYNATTTHQTEEDIETEKQQIKKLNGLKN